MEGRFNGGFFALSVIVGRGLYLEGRFNGGFFALSVLGGKAYIWRGDLTEVFCVTGFRVGGGLYLEGLILEILRYSSADQNTSCIYIYLKLSFKTS